MQLKPCRKLPCGKAETPEDTIARLEPVIAGLHDYAYLEQKVADHLHWSVLFIDELGFRAMGKGTSSVLSKAGALAESAEWLTARETSLLPGYVAAHQNDLPNPVRIEDLLAHVDSATPAVVDRIKDTDCAQHWVEGASLIDGSTWQVPIEYIRRISGPNGLAAGNRNEEALDHALCEVFERRAHITVLKNRMVVPTIDIETVDHPVVREHIDFVRSKGIEVHLKDLSFGGELPCIGAYFLDTNIPVEFQFHHFFKVGSAFDREEALVRCFTEYAQGRKLDEFIEGRRDEQDRVLQHDFRALKCTGDDDDNFLSAFMFGFVPCRNADFLREGELVPFDKGCRFDDFLEDIGQSKEIFRKLGKDCILVDHTDPQIGFPVIEVVVPGYSDVLPYHPVGSDILFRNWTRDDVLESYE